MIKTLQSLFKKDKDFFVPPNSVQRSIPIERIYKDSIWQCGNKFTKQWCFSDINYSVAGQEDKMDMFIGYCNLLNALPTDASTKITVNNRKLDKDEFAKEILLPLVGDSLDEYRKEYNAMLSEKAEAGNNIVQEKYVTVSVVKKNIEEARNFFTRVHNDLSTYFAKLSSSLTELNNTERLRILCDFYRGDSDKGLQFDLAAMQKRGHNFKDFIVPDSIEYKRDHFNLGRGVERSETFGTGSETGAPNGPKVGRVLFLREYASYIKDTIISELADFSRNLMISVDIITVPTDEAVKEMQNRVMAVESDVTRWQQKQNEHGNFNTSLPYDMEQMRKDAKEFLDDLTGRDQRMMFGLVTIVHTADDLEKLNADTETILSIGSKHMCQFAPLSFQQEDGLNTALPYGLRRIEAMRTLTTESLAVLMPFNSQKIMDKNGIYIGVNPTTGDLIIVNRKELLNGNGFILGVPGSGKSMAAKQEAFAVILKTTAEALKNGDDVLIIDPEREWGKIAEATGGEVIKISANSVNYINALDMSKAYEEGENPVILKSEFIMSLCEQLVGGGKLGAKDKSIIDRCTSKIYKAYLENETNLPPTLKDFHAELLVQKEPEAADIALAIELFTTGSLNVFAHQTNVNLQSSVIVYDILELGKQLKTVGMLVMLDAILNRVSQNREKGKRTHIYFDEMHLFFANEYSSSFLSESWKRFRKYGALASGITQNITDCLQSHTARSMLANSEFLVLLNQAPTDRAELAKLLHISETQMSYITNAEAGSGLIKVQGALVPFVNKIPKNTQLYKLMSTKPSEISDGFVNSRKTVI